MKQDNKKPASGAGFFRHRFHGRSISALAGLEAAIRLVDDVNAAFAAYDLAIAVPGFERAQRVAYFHHSVPFLAALSLPVRHENENLRKAGGGE